MIIAAGEKGEKMRLIDADEAYKILTDYYHHKTEIQHKALKEAFSRVPTVDAVEVVRCRDCKWWDKDDNHVYGYCMAMKHGYMSANWEIAIYRKYKGDFWCADGEREEDGSVNMG